MEEVWRPRARLDRGLGGPGWSWAVATPLSSFGWIAATASR